MKAFLLAAGLGTRLRPLTDRVPKCLAPIAGAPLLQHWLELLARHGVEDVLVNTHHLAEQVRAFAASWASPPRITLAHEPTLVGSAGTLACNWTSFVGDDDSVLVCYADNLTDIDLTALLARHRAHDRLVTMALFETDRPTACGIVELDPHGRVISFEEKPTAPRSTLANAGIYVMRAGVRALLPATTPADIGFELLPRCAGQIEGWMWRGTLIDIRDAEAHASAQRAWADLSV